MLLRVHLDAELVARTPQLRPPTCRGVICLAERLGQRPVHGQLRPLAAEVVLAAVRQRDRVVPSTSSPRSAPGPGSGPPWCRSRRRPRTPRASRTPGECVESAPSLRKLRLISKTRSMPPTTARLRNSSGAIRRYRSMSNAFMCVTNGRAAAPPGCVCSIGVSISTKPRAVEVVAQRADHRRAQAGRLAGRRAHDQVDVALADAGLLGQLDALVQVGQRAQRLGGDLPRVGEHATAHRGATRSRGRARTGGRPGRRPS